MTSSSCCDPGASPPTDAQARRARARKAALLLGCALILAWLGPAWHVPTALNLLGALLLYGFGAAQLFFTEAPGAFPRSSAFLLVPVVAWVVVGPFVPQGSPAGEPALVEVFLPVAGAGAEGRPPELPRELDGDPEGDPEDDSALAEGVVWIAWDLSGDLARARLGRLARFGGPLSEAEAAGVVEAIVFVNGAPLSALESIGSAVERERASGRGGPRVREDARGENGSRELIIGAPSGASYLVLSHIPGSVPGSAASWRRVVDSVAGVVAEGRLVIPPKPRDPAGLRRTLVVSVDEDVVGVLPLP